MNNNNSNIFVGDRSYKTNFFLQFQSNRTERKFREDTFKRNSYPLKGFIILSLLLISIQFTTTDCYVFYHSCGHPYLLISAMISAILSLTGIYFKIKHFYIQIFIMILSIYFHMSFLEGYSYHTALLLMTLYASIASFLLNQVWFLQIFSNMISYGLLWIYVRFISSYDLIRKSELDFGIDLTLYNLVALFSFGFLEKGRKERWVLVETFKKSDKIFRQLYEELPYAFFVIDKTKRILYSSMHGLALLSFYFPNCRSCNFSRLNINLKDILESDYGNLLDETFRSASQSNPHKEPEACFVTLKNPSEQYDPQTCRFTLEKDNLYKIKVIQTIWKANYAYLVVLKDYSSKKKSEQIASKTVNYLSRHVGDTINELDAQVVDKRQLKSKSKILSKMMYIKSGIYNTLLIFYRIFNKNEGLKEKKNFNIKTSILSAIGILSFKAKEKNCDLQLKFEHSFPNDIFGDEILFQQTFINVFQMIIEKLKHTSLLINCNLASVTANGQYVLSFEFKFPKSDSINFDILSDKIESNKPVILDNVLSGDDLLFFLALIKPAVEVFGGKLEVEDHDTEVSLFLKLNMNGSEASQEKSVAFENTLKSCNYNASSNPKPYLYFWKCEEPEEAHEAEDLSKSQVENLSNSRLGGNRLILESPVHSFIRSEQDEAAKRSQAKQMNGEKNFLMGRMDQKKVREELQKASMGGIKNFGSQDSLPIIEKSQSFPNLEVISKKKKDETLKITENNSEEPKLTLPDMKEEEEEKERTQVRKGTEENIGQVNTFQTDYRTAEITSYTSLPEIDYMARIPSSFQTHHYNLKLSLTKALMDIIDEQKKDSLKKNNRSTIIVPILEGITLEERVEGVEIKETELCEKALKYLSAKLEDEKDCEEFMVFAAQYSKSLEEDIYKLQNNEENDQSASLPYNSPHGGDSMESPKINFGRTGKERKGQSSFKLQWSKTNLDFGSANEFEKPKEKNLNERFLLTPSLTRTMTLRNQVTLKSKEAFAQLLQSPPIKQIEESPVEGVFIFENPPETESLYKELLPFEDRANLPAFIMYRTIANKRKWTGAPNEIVNNAPERMFVYNEEFTILAVDDSAFVFQALEALPIKYKKKFEFARNGTEAVKKYLSNINQGILYHFILLDLQMPVMDGFETARVIRAEEANKNFPTTYICAMSAFEDQETINRTKKDGMDNFCQKPLRTEVLNNLIVRRCEQIGISVPE